MMKKFLKLLSNARNSILLTWLISYICVLFIPVTGSSIVYYKMINIVKEDTSDTNLMFLSNIRKDFDSLLVNVDTISSQLLINDDLKLLSHYNDSVWKSDFEVAMDFVNQMQTYKLAISGIDNFFIYFENNDTVISADGISDADVYFGLNDFEKYFFGSDLKAKLQEYSPGSYIKINNSDEVAKKIIYYKSLAAGEMDPNKRGTIVIVFDEGIFKNKILESDDFINNKSSIFICNENDVVFSTDKSYNGQILELKDKLAKNHEINAKINNVKIVVTHIKSQYNNWYYICATPESVYWEKLTVVRNTLVFSIILSLMIGFATVILIVSKNYKPVQKVVNLLDYKNGVSTNEFHFIENKIVEIMNEKNKAIDTLHNQSNAVRTLIFRKLLYGEYDNNIINEMSFDNLEINFISDDFAVILFSVDCYYKLFEDDENISDDERYELCKFILSNVFNEICNVNNKGYIFEANNFMVCILNFKDDDKNKNCIEMQNMVKELNDFVEKNFSIYYSASASQICKTFFEIKNAYSQAVDVMEYKAVMGIEDYMEFGQLEVKEVSSYGFDLVKEQQFANKIKTGDYEGCRVIVDEIFNESLNNKTLNEIKCIVFDMVGTLMKCLDEITIKNETDRLRNSIEINTILKSNKISEIKIEIQKALKTICDYISQKHVSNDIIDDVKQFIMENYLDSELNLTQLGEKFGLVPSYLSKLFKNKTNISLLNYLNDFRMEKATVMLLETNYSIEEICLKCGYNNIHTFLRIFKKRYGVTPGKYREIKK